MGIAFFAMKRPSDNESTEKSVKKKKISNGFTMDTVPRHHYHLGDGLFAVVSDFLDSVKVHLRVFKAEDGKTFYPTVEGLVMTPVLWEQFFEIWGFLEPTDPDLTLCVAKQLFLTTFEENGTHHLHIQSVSISKGHLSTHRRKVVLTSEQWCNLKEHSENIRASIHQLMFGDSFKKLVFNEIRKVASPVENSEPLLAESFRQVLKMSIETTIDQFANCDLCKVEEEFGLGHACMFSSRSGKVYWLFYKTIASLIMKNVAEQFVQESRCTSKKPYNDFFSYMDIHTMLESAKNLYISEDPLSQ